MKYKKYYKMVINWDTDDNLYWRLYKKERPIFSSDEERAMLKEELTKLLDVL